MTLSSEPLIHPAMLPPGTEVGPWRVVEWAGRGANGVVYRAVRIGQESLPAVALKLAMFPEDPRSGREREMLSRTLHPHLPRLVDSGFWVSAHGARHPFVAMEWIDGVSLYEWGLMFLPSAVQQLRRLSQVALALQYLHAQGALHRDVKGANIFVRRSDSRVFLMDFGSCIYPDADPLTPQLLSPGTPAYRSPEAWLFSQRHQNGSKRYRAGPADDVYALGVTACVLATGKYPEMGELRKDAQGAWFLDSLKLPRALFSDQVAAPLREMILRMLSLRREERGTAGELAPALERAADMLASSRAFPSASVPEPGEAQREPAPVQSPRAPVHSHPAWIAVAVAAGALATWAGWMMRGAVLQVPGEPVRVSEAAHPASRAGSPEAEPVGLGEAAASVTAPGSTRPPPAEPLASDSPPEPFEGQTQPDKKGRCPRSQHVIFNGSCWGRLKLNREECEDVEGQMYQGACYVPIFSSGAKRPNTSGSGNPY